MVAVATKPPARASSGPAKHHRPAVNLAQAVHVEKTAFPELSEHEIEHLRGINRQVNRDITYLSDELNYGVKDLAVSEPAVRKPAVFGRPAARYGDCEDYALTKKERLIAEGWEPGRLVVALVSVPVHHGMARHAVLAVPHGEEWIILCNHHSALDRASALEQRWGWRFIWPHYRSYRETFAAGFARGDGRAAL